MYSVYWILHVQLILILTYYVRVEPSAHDALQQCLSIIIILSQYVKHTHTEQLTCDLYMYTQCCVVHITSPPLI